MRSILSIILIGFFLCCAAEENAQIKVSLNNESGIFKIGEEAVWTVSVNGVSKEEAAAASYKLLRDGKEQLSAGTLDLSSGAKTFSGKLDKPGTMIVHIQVPYAKAKKGKHLKKDSGAVVAPGAIKPSMPVPDDFDAFWEKQLKRQEAVPMNAQLTPETVPAPNVLSWKISMDTIDGQKIQGRLCKHKKEGKRPALLIVQWAGVYGLNPHWSIWRADNGFLVLNILAHDLPIDKDKAFYKEMANGKLKRYATQGNDDREKSYFLRMFLSCSRGVDYLAQHPDWDGKNLIVTGGSQGGFQAFVAAGLNKKVTAVIAAVPAGCGHTAPVADRGIPWPSWLHGDENNEAKINASRYYDGVNFASRMECPTLVGFGLGDPVSRSTGIIAAINQMKGPVEAILHPHGNHSGPLTEYDPRSKAWYEAVLQGKKIPIKATTLPVK